jgi:hypothetical protein
MKYAYVVNPPTEPGVYPCTVKTHAGPEQHCCLWDGDQWLWLDSTLTWDPVQDSNCHVLAWNFNLPDTVSKAVHDVMKERHRQDAKWGGPEHDDEHTQKEFETFIEDRLDYGLNVKRKPYRQRMVEVAALAIAALESCDRKAEHETRMQEGREMVEENRPRQGE